MYDPQAIAGFFDQYGAREWDRLTGSPLDEINLHLHTHYLHEYIPAGARVLEIGAGAGRFTQTLAEIGARITVADISPVQLALNRSNAGQYNFAQAVTGWDEVDIVDLSRYPDASFDQLVAYGGPFSYVLDQRDAALHECLRALKPGGRLLASVMSMWGTIHRHLRGVISLDPAVNQRVTASGDLTPATLPERKSHFMHMFSAAEIQQWLSAFGLNILALSASGVLASGELTPDYEAALRATRQDPLQWSELLRMELEASAAPGCQDMGTHLIFVAENSP